MSGHRYPPLDQSRATPLTTPSCVLITAPTQHIVPMRCLEICGISCFTTFPIYSMGHGVPRSSPTYQPPYLYTYRCDYVSTAYRIYSIYQPLHLAYTYISYSFILFYTRYCIIIASALSPPGISWHILYTYPTSCGGGYCILYHLFYLSTISRVFLYLVVSMYIGTISWTV